MLDVAGGSGRLGRYLAERAAFAVIADLTPEMLATGAASAAEDGARNVLFAEGDATRLPFPDAQFDVVVSGSRFTISTTPGSRRGRWRGSAGRAALVAVIDMAAEDGGVAARRDELERLRDPSHTRALASDELVGLLGDAGIAAELAAERHRTLDAVPLDRAGTTGRGCGPRRSSPPSRPRPTAAPPTGLAAARTEEGLVIRHLYVIAAGRRG